MLPIGRRKFTGSMKPVIALFLIALLLLCGVVLYAFNDAEVRLALFRWRLGAMGYADYNDLVARVAQEGRRDEARLVANFVIANSEMPGQDRMREQARGIGTTDGGDRSIVERGMDVIGGFMSGGGSSAEEQFGGLISNLLLGVGVPEEHMPRRGGEGDGALSKALGRAHLGVDGVWFPAVMGTLEASGRMMPSFERFLEENAEASAENGAPTDALTGAVRDTQRLVSALGVSAAVGLFGSVRDGQDLSLLAEWGRLARDETYLVASQGGMDVLSKLPPAPEGTDLLRAIARKGEPAIASARFWLK